jgi:hypothetical protein
LTALGVEEAPMGITAIVSFTNLLRRELEVVNDLRREKLCNSCSANSSSTVWRDRVVSSTGQPSQCIDMWIPWCFSEDDFNKGARITIGHPNEAPLYWIWQYADSDGDFVRYSRTGYAKPGEPIPGDARVTGNSDRGLTVNGDGTLNLWHPDPSVEIPWFPDYLHHEHMHWHMEEHTGAEFLEFHRDFVARFHQWYDQQGFADQSLVAPWSALPAEFRQAADPEAGRWFNEVRKLETELGRWTTDDAFGQHIQSGGLHRWLHHVPITTVYRDTRITNFQTAPTTRHFYQLHGLIDAWWQRWRDGRAAVFVSQAPESVTVSVGQQFVVDVTMKNTGRAAWPAGGANPVRLGSQNPPDNTRWGLSRIGLGSDIQPSQDALFRIVATAPLAPGRRAFQWRMLQEGVQWFGDYTNTILVDVRSGAGPTTVPDLLGMSRTQASNAIRAAELVPRFTGVPTGQAEVQRQTPVAGAVVDRGSAVTAHMVRLN